MLDNRRVVILGAGSAGLTAASELVKNGVETHVVEIRPAVGGLASTFTYNRYRLDYGPHAFHVKGDEVDEVFKRFCEGNYVDIYMRACLLLHRKYFEYPLRFGEALLRLSPLFTGRMLYDYFRAQLKRLFYDIPEDSFEAWGVKRYGRTMYEMAFGNYSRKVWGIPTTQLSRKLAEQKLPDLSFFDLVREALGGKGAKQRILYSSYLYPTGGIGTVFENMARFIKAGGGVVHRAARALTIDLADKKVQRVVITDQMGATTVVECSHLISTIPIPDVVNAVVPPPPGVVLRHANQLTYRHLILVFLVIDRPNVTGQIMVYLLDKDFTFNRIGEQKNIDPSMIPADETVLCFEICTDEQSGLWSAPDEELFRLAKQDLSRLPGVTKLLVKEHFVRRLERAYPIYDLEFDKHLSVALDYLLGLSNLLPLGRQGLFINNDVHDSMKMGLEGARLILEDEPTVAWAQRAREYLNWRLQ